MIEISEDDVKEVDDVARDILQFPKEGTSRYQWDCKERDSRYRALFGAPLLVITATWQLIKNIDNSIEIKHLFWALVFLKVYDTEDTHLRLVGWPKGGKKEFREKSWRVVEILAQQKNRVVRLEKRRENAPERDGFRTVSYIVSDCADFHINEPRPFEPKWKSVKFNGPGLKYLIAIAIYSNNICFTAGPYPATESESTITKQTLLRHIPRRDPIEVDKGPGGDPRLMSPEIGDSRQKRKLKSICRARVENVISRIKTFCCMDGRFRHTDSDSEVMMFKHMQCFEAVIVVTQIKFMLKQDDLFSVPDDMETVTYVMP